MYFRRYFLRTLEVLAFISIALFAAHLMSISIGCPLKRLMGFPCPGCGMTHAFMSLIQLDFRAAWTYNPAIYAFAVGGILHVFCRLRILPYAVPLLALAVVYGWRLCFGFPAVLFTY